MVVSWQAAHHIMIVSWQGYPPLEGTLVAKLLKSNKGFQQLGATPDLWKHYSLQAGSDASQGVKLIATIALQTGKGVEFVQRPSGHSESSGDIVYPPPAPGEDQMW